MAIDIKARTKAILVAELDETELAVRIAEACIGLRRQSGATAAQCLVELRDPEMAARFRDAAVVAMKYIQEAINVARVPS